MSEKMIFCLGEGKYELKGEGYQKHLRIFNKYVTEDEYTKVKNSLVIKNFKLPIAKWIKKEDMTRDEKDNYSSYRETGGYLKKLSYQYAWKEMWNEFSQSDKTFFKEIPHFDAKIFEKITGIKIDDEVEEMTVEEVCKRLGKTIKIVK